MIKGSKGIQYASNVLENNHMIMQPLCVLVKLFLLSVAESWQSNKTITVGLLLDQNNSDQHENCISK